MTPVHSISQISEVVLVRFVFSNAGLIRHIRAGLDQFGPQSDILLANLRILQLVFCNGK